MAKEIKHLLNEPDIGSGETSAGQEDVQRDVESVGGPHTGKPLNGSQLKEVVEEQQYAEQRHPEGQQRGSANQQADSSGRTLQSGTHLARITTHQQPDGTFEAQVYVRLTREPEVAETYIPAGTFGTEAEALAAAEERAQRALKEHEF
jgi:hypothetical protein